MTSYTPPVANNPWQNPLSKEIWRWTCDACGFSETFTVPKAFDGNDIRHYCFTRHNELTQQRCREHGVDICTRDQFKEKGRYGRD